MLWCSLFHDFILREPSMSPHCAVPFSPANSCLFFIFSQCCCFMLLPKTYEWMSASLYTHAVVLTYAVPQHLRIVSHISHYIFPFKYCQPPYSKKREMSGSGQQQFLWHPMTISILRSPFTTSHFQKVIGLFLSNSSDSNKTNLQSFSFILTWLLCS